MTNMPRPTKLAFMLSVAEVQVQSELKGKAEWAVARERKFRLILP
jgi:hypothetical protein